MDLFTCFSVLFEPQSSEQLQEAEAAIGDLKENNPLLLLQAMGEMVANEEIPISRRKQIISIMTMPIKRGNSFFAPFKTSTELVEFVFQTLLPILVMNNELSFSCIDVLVFYLVACLDKQPFFMQLAGTINEESSDQYILSILKSLDKYPRAIPRSFLALSFFIDLVQAKVSNEEIFLTGMRCLESSVPFRINEVPEEYEPIKQKFIEFFFTFLLHYPKITAPISQFVFEKEIPQVPSMYIECLQQNPECLLALNYLYGHIRSFDNDQIQIIFDTAIQTISLEGENFSFRIEATKDQNDESLYDEVPQSHIIQTCFDANPFLIPNCVQFIKDHIQENSTDEKFICALINNAAHNFLTYTAPNNSDYQDLPPNEELYPIKQEELYPFLIEDENPRIQKYGLFIQSNLISENKLEITEEILQNALASYTSESTFLRDGGLMIINEITKKQNQEAIQYIIIHLWEIINQWENDDELSAISYIFPTFSKTLKNIQNDFATQLLEEVWNKLQEIYEADATNISISWYLEIVSNIIPHLTVEQSDILMEVANFATRLLSEDRVEDGAVLLNAVCGIAGDSNQELIEFTLSFAIQTIPNLDNADQLLVIVKLCITIVQYFQDEEQLANITQNIISYMQTIDLKYDLKIKMLEFLIEVSMNHPQIILTYINEILSIIRFSYPPRWSVHHSHALHFYNIVFNYVIENGLTLEIKYFLNTYIRAVLNSIAKSDEAGKTEILDNMLSLLSRAVEVMQHPLNIYRYAKDQLFQVADDSRKEIINQLLTV